MCRRGIFKNWSGGKINVPVCPVGGPTKVQQLFGMMGGSSKVADTFVQLFEAIQSYDLAKVDDACRGVLKSCVVV